MSIKDDFIESHTTIAGTIGMILAIILGVTTVGFLIIPKFPEYRTEFIIAIILSSITVVLIFTYIRHIAQNRQNDKNSSILPR